MTKYKLIRHKDLVANYDFVVVRDELGDRECKPKDVVPGEIVELPDPQTGDYHFFRVLPNLS